MIHFTKEHYESLQQLAADMLFANEVINYGIGQPKNIIELLHATSIETLNRIKQTLSKKIEEQENKDEWVDPDSTKLAKLRRKKELINLIIGWKRYNFELAENERRIAEIDKQLNDIDEATKTPEDKKKELLAERAKLTEFK
jgi:hypothetical protein